jgi:DNA adenine methylase
MKKKSIRKSSCRPFVKWAGGKSQLLPELADRLPASFNRYFEPFVGGGALFFHLQPQEACLSDITPDLINSYHAVRNSVEDLIKDLAQHRYERKYFELLRAADRSAEFAEWSAVKKASRMIYLNKTCFNGLYRLNNEGFFNTPFGRYKNPKIVDEENLRRCSRALEKTRISHRSFETAAEEAEEGDFIYLDPPYVPLNSTSNFVGYSKDKFSGDTQKKLFDLCCLLDKKKVKFMLSNSSTPWVLETYNKFNMQLVKATRAINSKRLGRGKIDEVIVTNY